MTDTMPTLAQLGWKPFFQQQLTLEELCELQLGRIIEHHRSSIIVMTEQGQQSLTLPLNNERICVGDWVLFDATSLKIQRSLERQSLFERKAPGSKIETQLIAANIDTVMIVCSLNQDFNLGRIERYLATAKQAQVEPVIILSKADLCTDVQEKQSQVQALDPLLAIYAVNALDEQALLQLHPFCKQGKTVAFLGSSGVGKSTLVNGLVGSAAQQTAGIREDDSKGRHTTTFRALKMLPQGGMLMDTPGMRELQLSHCEQGVSDTFNEITALALQCKFSNCAHTTEPGCAITAAIENGTLSARRLHSYQKLNHEQAVNSATLLEKKSKERALGKLINSAQHATKRYKKGY